MRDNTELGRYELDEQGSTVFADYRREGDTLIIDYVESPPPLRGSGAAGRLMEAVVADARLNQQKIVPICGYAAAWLKRNGHGDIIA